MHFDFALSNYELPGWHLFLAHSDCFKRLLGAAPFPFSQQRSYYTPTNADISIVRPGLAMLSVPNIVGVEYCVLAISWQTSVARNWRAWEPRTITLVPQPLPSISVTTLVVIVAVAEPIKYEPIDVKLIVLLQAVLHSVFPLSLSLFHPVAVSFSGSLSVLGFSVCALLTTTAIKCRRSELLHYHFSFTPSIPSECTEIKKYLLLLWSLKIINRKV